MMTKTLLGVSCLVLLHGVCFADDGGHDSAPVTTTVPHDGWRTDVTFGAARFPSASMDLGTGVSASVLFGREWMHDHTALQLGVELESQSYGHVLTSSGDVNTYSVRPTARISYYTAHWMPYADLGVGYTYASQSATPADMNVSASDNMLAIAATAGVSYRIGDRFALGPYVRYEPSFEPALNQFVDFGVSFAVLH